MSGCFECQSISNFSCTCSGSLLLMCKYHTSIHSSHSEFKFINTNSIRSNLQDVVNLLEHKNVEISRMIEKLTISQQEIIANIELTYENHRSKLAQASLEIEEAINFLNKLQQNDICENLAVIRFIVDPGSFPKDSLVFMTDNSKKLLNKLKSCVTVETSTNMLLKQVDLTFFDANHFAFEKQKAITRQKILKKLKKNPNIYNAVSRIISRSINKRILLPYIPKNEDELQLTFDTLIYGLEYSDTVDNLIIPIGNEVITNQFLNLGHRLKKISYFSLKNFIKSDNQHQIIFSALKNKKLIKHINLKGNYFTGENLRKLLGCFNFYKERLRSLNLSCNLFSAEGCLILGEYLPSFSGLRDLNISYNDIGAQGIFALSSSLSEIRTLEDLNVKNNDLKAEGITYLMNAISHLPYLSVLNVSNNDGHDEGVLAVAGKLKYMKMLMVLHVDFLITKETLEILKTSSNPYTQIYRRNGKQQVILVKEPIFS